MAKKFHALKRLKNGRTAVIAKSTGKVLGSHPTRAEAYKQLQAIEAHKHEGY